MADENDRRITEAMIALHSSQSLVTTELIVLLIEKGVISAADIIARLRNLSAAAAGSNLGSGGAGAIEAIIRSLESRIASNSQDEGGSTH